MRCRFVDSIFQNPQNGWCVCIYKTLASQIPQEARRSKGRITTFTARGLHLPMTPTSDVELEGQWVSTDKHGVQLEVDASREMISQTKEGVLDYLKSGSLVEMDSKTANAIYATFKEQTIEVLETHPERLRAVLGVKPDILQRMQEELVKRRAVRGLLTELEPFGADLPMAEKAVEKLGCDAPRLFRAHPFCLYQVGGFNFELLESISRSRGADPMDPARIESGLCHTLKQAAKQGHLFLPRAMLLSKTQQLLVMGCPATPALAQLMEDSLKALTERGVLREELDRVYLAEHRYDEVLVAQTVVALLLKKTKEPERLDQEISDSQKKLGMQLSATQIQAVKAALIHPLSIITGGPGTGKTTTLRVILDIYQRIYPQKKILLAAPTGRASRRMVESTGFDSASTLHSALEIGLDDNGERKSKDSPLDADLIVVDEWSMGDMNLAMELFSHLRPTTQLVFLGDPDQLPSVGPGDVLRELLRCRLIPVTRLDVIFRQEGSSSIPLNSFYINTGDIAHLQLDKADFKLERADISADAFNKTLDVYMDEVSRRGVDGVQILSPVRHKGLVCVDTLNAQAQRLVNPPSIQKAELRTAGRFFRVGDKVMQNENRDEASNGDLGFITAITKRKGGEPHVTVKFSGGRTIDYPPRDLLQLELAYATTVHKSQGSEFDAVVLPVLAEHSFMLKRNLLYTGVTRAKAAVRLVGQESALQQAIRNNDNGKRYTLLADRIVAYYRKALKSSNAVSAARK